jgi:glycosyltransferase involved in cell wall biosynthesis
LLSSTGFHGAEAMAAELIRHSVDCGVESHVGVFGNAGKGDCQIIDIARPYLTGNMVIPCKSQFDFATVKAIAQYVRDHDIDVVHSHKYKTTFHALLARRRQSFALVSTYHNWLKDSRSLKLYAAIDKLLARFCDAAIGVSAAVSQELAHFVPEKRVFHIENGVDCARFSPPLARADAQRALRLGLGARPVVGFVGRLTAQKGVNDLIDAMGIVQSAIAADVLIVGDGEERVALEQRAAAAAFGDRIRFLGSRSDTPALYGAMDLLVLPSSVEAFPMVLIEAMACEVPVVGTPVGDVPRIITPETGWITPQGQPAALARVILQALQDPGDRQSKGKQARERVVKNFSAQRMAQRYFERYEAALSR